MVTIGIRELRQQASKYLRRVERGETFTITDRDRPVAQLGPIPQRTQLEQMLADGRARPPKGRRDLADITPARPEPDAPLLSEVLAQMRRDER